MNGVELEKQRERLWILGFSDKQIAQTMNIPEEAVRGWRRWKNKKPRQGVNEEQVNEEYARFMWQAKSIKKCKRHYHGRKAT